VNKPYKHTKKSIEHQTDKEISQKLYKMNKELRTKKSKE